MTSLVACLGPESPAWDYMRNLVSSAEWDSIFLICSEESKAKFSSAKPVAFITVDSRQPLPFLVDSVRKSLDGKIVDTEVAVNMALGSGKEHMALLAAVLRLGLGVRLVAYTHEGLKEL